MTPVRGIRISKFTGDLIWTHGAFAIMASSGLLLNLLLGIAYGAEGLGVFSQAMAAYVVMSQLSVGGAHLAVFRSVAALEQDNEQDLAAIGASGVLVAGVWGAVGGVILLLAAAPLGALLQSPAVGTAIFYVSLALPFTAVNKVLIAILNARQRMRHYSIAQATRYLLLLAFVAGAYLLSRDVTVAALCFVAAEASVLTFLLIDRDIRLCLRPKAVQRARVTDISKFGVRAMGSGLAAELNIRTDIFMIGLLMNDTAAGVYALASVIYEGVLNAVYAVRTNLNPILVRSTARSDWSELERLLRRLLLILNPIAVMLLVAAWLFYEPVIGFVFNDPVLAGGLSPLLILMAPLTLLAGFLALDQLILQSGRAGAYTLVLAGGFVLNIVLNAVLVPVIGLDGAALSTAAAFAFTTLALFILFCRGSGCRPDWRRVLRLP